jgi:hypothetical protein
VNDEKQNIAEFRRTPNLGHGRILNAINKNIQLQVNALHLIYLRIIDMIG